MSDNGFSFGTIRNVLVYLYDKYVPYKYRETYEAFFTRILSIVCHFFKTEYVLPRLMQKVLTWKIFEKIIGPVFNFLTGVRHLE